MEMIKKECKVVMLPTNEKSHIYHVVNVDKLRYVTGIHKEDLEQFPNQSNTQNQHLYILSDDEIKEGDYLISITGNILKCNNPHRKEIQLHSIGKIIATTDSFLNLPQPSQAFIKKYCESNSEIKEVMVEYVNKYFSSGANESKWHECTKEAYELIEKDYWFDTKKEIEIKTNSKNEVSISPVKSSWTKEEVYDLVNKFSFKYTKLTSRETILWLEENL